MMKEAIIIFVRHPEPGKVKTRLAATIGKEEALVVYKKLLQHTLTITEQLAADKFIFYANDIVEYDMWQRPGYYKAAQAQGDLGARMAKAFEQVFAKEYTKVCIIGSDCFELTACIIEDAFRLLQENEIVIGPAKDGGYYLLGMKKQYADLFVNKAWSTSTVYRETLQVIESLKLTNAVLPTLRDVDEANDLPIELFHN